MMSPWGKKKEGDGEERKLCKQGKSWNAWCILRGERAIRLSTAGNALSLYALSPARLECQSNRNVIDKHALNSPEQFVGENLCNLCCALD